MKKKSIIICIGLGILLFASAACNHKGSGSGQMKNDTTPATFATASAAATQAQNDMLEILRSDKDVNLGISDTAALANAIPGKPIQRFSIDFNKLLSADSTATLTSLQQEELNTVIPLVNEKQLVTVVELRKAGEQWKIASLAGKALSDDLNIVMTALGYDSTAAGTQITLYEVPNLNAKLFRVSMQDRDMIFTDYNHNSLREGIPASSIIPVLKAHAISFQSEFGDQVKKQKLAE